MDKNISEVAVSVTFIITNAKRVRMKAAFQSLTNTRSFCDWVGDYLSMSTELACHVEMLFSGY